MIHDTLVDPHKWPPWINVYLVPGIFISFIFFHPIHHLRPSILSLLVVSQIRGHTAGSSPLLPTTVRALDFYRAKISALSSLVDSRRIVLCTIFTDIVTPINST